MATRLLCVCVWYLKIDYSIFRRLFALFLNGRSRVNWWLLNVSLSKYIHNTYTDVCVCTTVMGILSLYKSVQPTISILTDKQTNRTHTTVRNELRFSTEAAATTPDDAMLVACVHQETMRESRKCTPLRSLSLFHTLSVSLCACPSWALSLSLSLSLQHESAPFCLSYNDINTRHNNSGWQAGNCPRTCQALPDSRQSGNANVMSAQKHTHTHNQLSQLRPTWRMRNVRATYAHNCSQANALWTRLAMHWTALLCLSHCPAWLRCLHWNELIKALSNSTQISDDDTRYVAK